MLSLEHQTWRFLAVVGRIRQRICIEVRAARAARLFFLIQPIISVIYGVSIVVTVTFPRQPHAFYLAKFLHNFWSHNVK